MPSLLADTFGDRSFGSPKRIPSLLGNFHTAPFGWTGNNATIEDQVRSTLESTMHGAMTNEAKNQTTQNLVQYLKSLKLPNTSNQHHDWEHAKSIFEAQGCANCHLPEQEYTSPKTYEIGIRDESSNQAFNPPSLIGLKYRRLFFHDGRYLSLDELLGEHPKAEMPLSDGDLKELKRFLLRSKE
ncbi:MAG: cytochrome c peroxidase [Pirellula sp.]